jgi:diamine N-acetyltransferase
MTEATGAAGDATTRGPEARVSLREVTRDTVREICRLEVGPGQDEFVAPNAVSIAQAHFEPKAWFRAIYSGDTSVGFVMLFDDPETPEYFLWRMMIAAEHQGKGYGRAAMELLIDYVRSRPGAKELFTSYVPGEGSPESFYLGLGFESTGRVDGDEVVLRLPLAP